MAGENEKLSTSRDQVSLVVSSCSNKRTKTENPSSSSTSEQSSFCLNDLQALLTEEILQRLPTSKSAFLCKSVCKNWYSLISTPYFVRRFITQHLTHQYKQNPSALIINYLSELNGYRLFTLSDEPMFKSTVFELNCLPERNGSVMVLAIFNDLMLCRLDEMESEFGQCCYYICNPFTMQWAALPPFDHDYGRVLRHARFVCEPYYFEDSQGDCTINSKYRFRVVHFASLQSQKIVMRTYRSETQQWYRSFLEGSEYNWCSNVVVYNGKLLWYNGNKIFAYDPFNPELSQFADCSFSHGTSCCIGVCKGFLRFMQFAFCACLRRNTLDIWELEDYATQEWRLKHKVSLDTMKPERSLIRQIEYYGNYRLKPLSFHPNDRDIVYLHINTFLISYNCQTRELKLVEQIPCKYGTLSRAMTSSCIELPLWPTPIPRTD